jgi:hypothetical protein
MYSSYSIKTSALDGVNGQRHAPAALLPPGNGPPVPTVQEAGWTPEPVWTEVIGKIPCLCWGSNLGGQVVQSVVRHCTYWATRLQVMQKVSGYTEIMVQGKAVETNLKVRFQWRVWIWWFVLMMVTVSTSETSVNFYQTIRRNIPEDILILYLLTQRIPTADIALRRSSGLHRLQRIPVRWRGTNRYKHSRHPRC